MTANFRQRLPVSVVEQPTNLIPVDCMCTWSVVTPGPGLACISRLTYPNALCSRSRDHEKRRTTTQVPPVSLFHPGAA